MKSGKGLLICAALTTASMCGGCAVPSFDVPADRAGQPNVETITQRVECELRDMVRDDRPNDATTFHRLFLLNGDYDVEIVLSLEVNETGGLAPSLSYINPLHAATSFMFGGTATLSESRDHNFTENIQLSARTIFTEWKSGANRHDCPAADTNLAGDLGIRNYVAMAALTPNLDAMQTISGKGVFGGSMQFLVTKNLSAVGPTWSLVHFKGPGGLASLGRVNTDKMTLAFAQGPNAGKKMAAAVTPIAPNPPNSNAHAFLQQLFVGSINSQLTILQNGQP